MPFLGRINPPLTRTRKDRTLELTSALNEYPRKGRYKIAVKVIDIFGNDNTKVVGVTI